MAMIVMLVGAATMAGGEREVPWYKDPGTAVTLTSSGFVFTARLPRGWSVTNGQVVPPETFASSCQVHGEFLTNREWNRFLVAALDPRNLARTAREERFVRRIGGHPAVSSRYTSDGTTVINVYINLSDAEPDSASVWSFKGDTTQEGQDCALQFMSFVGSANITRDAGE
jgi:hypothetical protein